MTKDQINQKYVAYVQQTIAENKIPESFDAWNTRRIAAEKQIKSFTFVLWSEQTKSWHHWTIRHADKDLAFLAAKEHMKNFDRRYAEEHGATKVMTVEERIEHLKKQIIQKRESMLRRIEKAQARLAKLKQETAQA